MIDYESDGDADPQTEQLSQADELLDRGVDDLLDEGYSPPDRPSPVHVPTADEERRGASLDELLGAEEPDPAADADRNEISESADLVGGPRAGRLVWPGDDGDSDVLATDVGVDGAGASAEEAAVHLIEDDDRG